MMRTTLDVAIAKPGGVAVQNRELNASCRWTFPMPAGG